MYMICLNLTSVKTCKVDFPWRIHFLSRKKHWFLLVFLYKVNEPKIQPKKKKIKNLNMDSFFLLLLDCENILKVLLSLKVIVVSALCVLSTNMKYLLGLLGCFKRQSQMSSMAPFGVTMNEGVMSKSSYKWRRVLLKVSGEALAGDHLQNIDPKVGI